MDTKRIVITPRGFAKYGIHNVKILKDAGFEVIFNDTGTAYTKEEFYQITRDALGIIIGVETVDRTYIDKHPHLRAIVKFGVGTDNIDVEYCRKKNISVGRTAGSNARSVAEMVISFLMADSKNLYESICNTRIHDWTKMTGYEIQGKTLGIIGFGAIGKEVAKMAWGLGMKILAYDVYGVNSEIADRYDIEVSDIETILNSSDFITLHVPLTSETRNMISLNELKLMKSNAVLINTARGGIVNEADLYHALTNLEIRAAYFDVFTEEPPVNNEPLLTLSNFYLTPHIASRSKEAEKNTADLATKIILELLNEKEH